MNNPVSEWNLRNRFFDRSVCQHQRNQFHFSGAWSLFHRSSKQLSPCATAIEVKPLLTPDSGKPQINGYQHKGDLVKLKNERRRKRSELCFFHDVFGSLSLLSNNITGLSLSKWTTQINWINLKTQVRSFILSSFIQQLINIDLSFLHCNTDIKNISYLRALIFIYYYSYFN